MAVSHLDSGEEEVRSLDWNLVNIHEELDADHLEARTSLGCVLAEQGDYELAAAALEGVLRQQPDYADAHWHMAGVLAELRQESEARRHLLTFLGLAPESPWADVARERLAVCD